MINEMVGFVVSVISVMVSITLTILSIALVVYMFYTPSKKNEDGDLDKMYKESVYESINNIHRSLVTEGMNVSNLQFAVRTLEAEVKYLKDLISNNPNQPYKVHTVIDNAPCSSHKQSYQSIPIEIEGLQNKLKSMHEDRLRYLKDNEMYIEKYYEVYDKYNDALGQLNKKSNCIDGNDMKEIDSTVVNYKFHSIDCNTNDMNDKKIIEKLRKQNEDHIANGHKLHIEICNNKELIKGLRNNIDKLIKDQGYYRDKVKMLNWEIESLTNKK